MELVVAENIGPSMKLGYGGIIFTVNERKMKNKTHDLRGGKMTIKFSEKLKELNACPEAVEWVGDRTEQEALEDCERSDWMLWYVFRAKIGTKKDRILATCACARTAIKHIPEGEERPRLAIEAAERYAEEPTEENRKSVVAAMEAAWESDLELASKAGWVAMAAYEAGLAAYFAAEAAAAIWESGLEFARKASGVAYLAAGAAWSAYFEAEVAKRAAHQEMCRIIREKIKLKVDECGGDI